MARRVPGDRGRAAPARHGRRAPPGAVTVDQQRIDREPADRRLAQPPGRRAGRGFRPRHHDRGAVALLAQKMAERGVVEHGVGEGRIERRQQIGRARCRSIQRGVANPRIRIGPKVGSVSMPRWSSSGNSERCMRCTSRPSIGACGGLPLTCSSICRPRRRKGPYRRCRGPCRPPSSSAAARGLRILSATG